MIYIQFLILSVFLNMVFIYIIINIYRKFNTLQKEIDNNNIILESCTNLISRLLALYTEAKNRMARVDKGGAYSSDDEVGFAFKLINSTIIELVSKLQQIEDLMYGEEKTGE